ncbi:acyl dehydratase [Pikeienuella piscinae]|uniref:Acyl dehydratase n=2 Tax=Pikeienuella piscinae TaxID=2748098 RepID=A0A7M3T7G9_9RHOB|nr:acyl dehydratase [Pikeienuella piscinae]
MDHPAIGRTRAISDLIDPWREAALHAALDLAGPPPGAGDALPSFHHWIYFLEAAPGRALGRDGHPATGGFIPDLGLPRRMWAGGRLEFHRPLPIGAGAERRTTIENITRKSGRSGPLAFVTLRHEISGAHGLAITEWQDLVYRDDADPAAPAPTSAPAPAGESRARAVALGPVALFRYSALTFNGHRIHYDREYARDVEGYPGLVVHGPLIAQLLLALAEEHHGPPARFRFRARAPGFDFEEITLCAVDVPAGARLWAKGADGRLLMEAETSAAPARQRSA